jgi:hypothetical protein
MRLIYAYSKKYFAKVLSIEDDSDRNWPESLGK